MTIGIGVLCSTHPKPLNPSQNDPPRPDAIIMFSDTMGSSEIGSTDQLHKMYFEPQDRLYAVCADKMEMTGEIFGGIKEALRRIPGTRTHIAIWEAITAAVLEHRRKHFRLDVLNPSYSFGGADFIPPEMISDVTNKWGKYDVGAQLLVGTFDDIGQALLYFVGQYEDEPALVHIAEFPGYQTIGTGGPNAELWLDYRQQTLSMNIRQSALHAYEARLMASKAPTVNSTMEMLIGTAAVRDSFHLLGDRPMPSGYPISLEELKDLARKYGPKSTDDLGFSTPSTPQTSAGQP